jgi:hypothetical protein
MLAVVDIIDQRTKKFVWVAVEEDDRESEDDWHRDARRPEQ